MSATIVRELYGEVAKIFYSFDKSTSGYVVINGQQVDMKNTSTVVTSDGPTTYYILTGTFDTNGGTLTQISFTTTYMGHTDVSAVNVNANYVVNLNVPLTAGTYPLLVVVTLQPGTVTVTLPQ